MGRRKTELTVSRTIEMFLDMLAAERGAAVNTLESYRRDLANFTAFTMVRKRDPEKADTPMIRKYFTQLSSRGMAPGTSAQHLSALRQFFKFLVSEGLREDNPCTTIDSPRLGRPLPKYLNEAEVETLLETANGHGGPEGFRLRALLEILYATGLRVSELVGMPMTALTQEDQMLVIRGKGGKERMVPLGGPASRAIAEYRDVRPQFIPGYKISESKKQTGIKMAVSFTCQTRAPHAGTVCANPQGTRYRGWAQSGAGVAACTAPFVRISFVGKRCGFTFLAAAVGARRYRYDSNLHARVG